MMDTDQGSCFGLDETGSFLWEHLTAPITVSTLVELCHERFDAPEGQIEADVPELLSQLLEKQLLKVCDPA
jgi:hypothetical protein